MKNFLKKIIIAIIQIEARLVLLKYKSKIIAVTGSVGKTSTKDAIYTVLSTKYFVRKSQKSFNSEIGVPLTILGLPNAWNNIHLWTKNILEGIARIVIPHKYPEWLVLEIGADHPGDIEKITKWIKPDVAVVTRLSDVPVHVEFFDSPEAVRQEKAFLAKAVKKSGTVILNADDKLVSSFQSFIKTKILTYGLEQPATVKANNYKIEYEDQKPAGISFKVDVNGLTVPISFRGSVGRQNVYTTIAALSVCSALNIDLEKAGISLSKHETPPGRMRLIEGINNSTIIDDTYNSSPVAAKEALTTLKEINPRGRKIAILGDMLELGKFTADEHYKVGVIAKDCADELYTVGARSRKACEATGDRANNFVCKNFDDSKELAKFIGQTIKDGDVILVKGSQGMRMERIVEALMKKPELKSNLLVRQDEEWARR